MQDCHHCLAISVRTLYNIAFESDSSDENKSVIVSLAAIGPLYNSFDSFTLYLYLLVTRAHSLP
jgi:hypothetical protein